MDTDNRYKNFFTGLKGLAEWVGVRVFWALAIILMVWSFSMLLWAVDRTAEQSNIHLPVKITVEYNR